MLQDVGFSFYTLFERTTFLTTEKEQDVLCFYKRFWNKERVD